MDERFREHVESLAPKLTALLAMQPVTATALPRKMPARGIYLFSEGDMHLYVGRSNTLRRRLPNHCRPGSNHRKAAFAFRLARQKTGKTHKASGTRAELTQDSTFDQAFQDAKARIRQMQVRFVEEVDATRQCLLEAYAAIVLDTPFNDFDNH
jgi:hypothetical protein